MYGCMAVWMYGCMDVWLYGCMEVWMYGCMAVWMYGCISMLLLFLKCNALFALCSFFPNRCTYLNSKLNVYYIDLVYINSLVVCLSSFECYDMPLKFDFFHAIKCVL